MQSEASRTIGTADTIILTTLFVSFLFMYNIHGDAVKYWDDYRNGADFKIIAKALKIFIPLACFSFYTWIQIVRGHIKEFTAFILGMTSVSLLLLAHELTKNVMREIYLYHLIENFLLYAFGLGIVGGFLYLLLVKPILDKR
ncbi:hypothetical protein [Lewinella sp. IMCC34191]|uniref:hypothetical protein n=1 Tax=Lewinella sp. IMCC34191 TaxID=2259172 RepID=UPI000E27EC9B|nr:hypothetical protein [Lewinella sp. IMCC34191]